MWMCDSLNRLVFTVRSRLRCRPSLYTLNRMLRGGDLYADEDTDIVIEGAPRSANSFVVEAFREAHEGSLRIGHHLHAAAHVIRSCSLGLPVLVLIRDPLDYLVSRRAFCFHVSVRVGECHPQTAVSYREFLRDWMRFYGTLWPYRNEFVVGRFDRVTEDLNAVVDQLNERFDKDFRRFTGGAVRTREVQARAGYHAGPSPLRDEIKETVRGRVEDALENGDGGLARELKGARAWYGRYAELA